MSRSTREFTAYPTVRTLYRRARQDRFDWELPPVETLLEMAKRVKVAEFTDGSQGIVIDGRLTFHTATDGRGLWRTDLNRQLIGTAYRLSREQLRGWGLETAVDLEGDRWK